MRAINTSLISSATKGNVVGMQAALGEGAHINFANKKGMTALIAARCVATSLLSTQTV
jgi:hypothetical protein